MNAISNSTLTIEEKFHRTETEINELIDIKENCKRKIGQKLSELKTTIIGSEKSYPKQQLNEQMFYEWTQTKFKFSREKSNSYMRMYEQFGTAETQLNEQQMREIVKAPIEHRDLIVNAIEELAIEEPTIVVPINKLNAAKAVIKGATEINIEDIKGVMRKEHNYELENKNKLNTGVVFAKSLMNAANLCWQADMSAQELADMIKDEYNDDSIPHLENLEMKMNRVWKILKIGDF